MVRALLLVSALLLAGCGGDPGTGPIDVKWDRAACERCRMVLSDRQHSAQIRHRDEGGKSRVHQFDDLGCALLWLDQQPWRDAAGVEIWVNERRSGEWIDARTAHYLVGEQTPMAYGLGAQRDASPDSLDFTAAWQHVRDAEERFNHPDHAASSTR